jgi:hypothetical protein
MVFPSSEWLAAIAGAPNLFRSVFSDDRFKLFRRRCRPMIRRRKDRVLDGIAILIWRFLGRNLLNGALQN